MRYIIYNDPMKVIDRVLLVIDGIIIFISFVTFHKIMRYNNTGNIR